MADQTVEDWDDDLDEDKPLCQNCGEQDNVMMPDSHHEKLFAAEFKQRRVGRVLNSNRLLFFALGVVVGAVIFGQFP